MRATISDAPLPHTELVTRDLYESTGPEIAQSPGLLAWAASFLIGVLLDAAGLETLPSICLAAISFPLLLAVARKRLARDVGSKTLAVGEAALREFLAAPPVMIDLAPIAATDRKGTVLTGAAYDGSWFYIVEDGVAARIPLQRIRSWTWKIEGHDHHRIYAAGGFRHVGAAAMMQIQANRDNVAGAVQAWRASGLFVQVADVAHPTWQFVTSDKAVLERWHEILTQLREGRLKAH